jgi:DNA-directed RNA polymerase subunit D
MELITQKENKIVFKTDINESLANAVRRYLNEIPTLAIEEVEISKNNSPLYDETLAHRLGLVPLKTEKSMNSKTEKKLKISSKKEGIVSSGDLKGDAKVVYEKIPLTYLDKDQEVNLTAIAKLGKGSEHSKHTPGLMFYRNNSEITMNKEFLGKLKKICPEIKVKEKGNNIIFKNEYGLELEDFAESSKSKVEINPLKELIITLENFGQIETKDLLKKSVEEIKKDLSEFDRKLK